MGSVSVRSQCRPQHVSPCPGESGRRQGWGVGASKPGPAIIAKEWLCVWEGERGADRSGEDSPAEILTSAKLLFHLLAWVWFGF